MSSLLGASPRGMGKFAIQESLKQIELFFVNQEKSGGSAMYNREAVLSHIDSIVFSGAEMYKRNINTHQNMSHFELVNEISSFCIRQKKDYIRYCIFDSLFSMSRHSVKDFRMHVLQGVVSMAIGLKSIQLMDCITVWMITTERDNFLEIVSSVYNDFCLTLPESSSDLRSCVDFCPQFACALLSAFYFKFSLQGTSQKSFPDSNLFEIILHWLLTDPNLCYRIIMIKDQNFHRWCATYRPTLQYPMPLCPLSGLITWCIKSPLSQSELSMSVGSNNNNINMNTFFNEHNQSRLQYSILKSILASVNCQASICKSMISSEPDFTLWSKDEVHALIGDILSYCTTGNTDEYLDKAVDKFAQISQLAISTGVFKCTMMQFQSLTDPLPKTKLMDMVAYGPKNNNFSDNVMQ